MEDTYLLNHPGVRKKILAGGTGPLPHFPPGTKLVFHFQTLLDNFERTVIDDSRLAGRPAEIFVGKMFKMEVWETLLTSMRVGEVAEFWCDAVHTGLYPIVSKGMRLIAQGKDPLEGQRHMCGMGNLFYYHSTGFPELDELMRTPQPLIFIMELLQVGDPMSYHRESWMMEKDEKLQTVPILHMQGNELVKQRQFRDAASKYKEAVLLLKTVQSREMPDDIDYINLGRMIIPLELNYCQCMLELEEYYEVIEHTTELLGKHKDCVKGYYKRAKAHAAVWNEKEARRDFNMVGNLDITLASLVHRELRALSERMKVKYWEEKEKYWNMLETKENKEEEEEGHDDDEEEEEKEEIEDKGKQEDSESVTRESKDEVGEEKGKEESPSKDELGGDKEGTVKVTLAEGAGNKGEANSSEINPDALPKTEGKDWQQMLRLVMLLQNEGNFLFKENHFEEASVKFKEAIEYVDFLQNKVDQESDDWESLEKVRLPLTLNLSQCMLELEHYQQVVELINKLLKNHKGNFKAVYQRALAHASLCNEDKARRDFAMVEKLDPKFKPFVRQELKKLGERIRTMHIRQNKTYRDTTQAKWGPGGSKTKKAARKENVKFTQKATEEKAEADKKTEESKTEERESSEKPAPAEIDGVDDTETEKSPDVKAEQSNKELESGRGSEEGLDNENIESVVVHEYGQGAPDNRATDKDSDPVPTSTGKDNVVSKRSACDKGKKKVKCQSSPAPGPSKTSQGNKATSDKTGNGGTQSE
ncbi:myb-like protein X isoform X1 [Seriola aureovittata]|uniref:myb-like protein X isoform X1 n=2 Tax=Seriola aureovittata TaxID=2871759 RepID=UPI0024BE86BD|nr:myb-like protein X isoform X1 [Seriola aureovittata]